MNWTENLMNWWQDTRHAVRRLRESPGFAFASITILALGIGVNTAIFSVVHETLIKSLPYRDAAQLCWVWVTNPRQGYDRDITSYPRFEDWRKESATFQSFTVFTGSSLALTGGDDPQQLRGASVMANFFEVLGAKPLLGRTFTPGEDEAGRDNVVVLSHNLWLSQFGGDTSVLGRNITLDSRPYQVIGVAQPGHKFPDRETQYWVPLVISPQARLNRGNFWLSAIGRLKPGITVRAAQADMSALAARLESRYREDQGLGILIVGLKDELTREIRPALWLLLSAAVCVFLISSANVSGMVAARSSGRERDIAVRAALGANRGRLIAHLLVETMVLFAVGGVAALLAGIGGIRLLKQLSPPNLAQLQDAALDQSMVFVTLAISVLAGLVFGLRPAFECTRINLAQGLNEGTRTVAGRVLGHRFRKIMVTVQIALSVVLLMCGGLLVRSFLAVQSVEPGFDSRRVAMARIAVPRSRYPHGQQAVQFYETLMDRLNARPGIQGTGAASSMFLSRLPNSATFTIEGRNEAIALPLTTDSVTPGFFRVLRIPLRQGRFFDDRDRPGNLPVVIINETAARRHWPNEDPIGKRFKFGGPDSNNPWLTIVGVVADTRRAGLENPVFTESYRPLAQQPRGSLTLVLRSSGPDPIAAVLRSELRALDPQLPIASLVSVEEALGLMTADRRFSTVLLGLFAATALLLAVVGLYGILTYFVALRRREIGIRIAIGADRRQVIGVVLHYSLSVLVLGLTFGAAAAAVAVRLLSHLLFGVTAWDPVTLVVVTAALGLALIAASVLPALKASSIDPLEALRCQ